MNASKPIGLSIKPNLLIAAKERARHQSRTFSGYVTYLLKRDLGFHYDDANKSTGQGDGQRVRKPAGR